MTFADLEKKTFDKVIYNILLMILKRTEKEELSINSTVNNQQ